MNPKLLPFALAALLSPALFAQDYAIKIQRPLKAGDELKLSVSSKQSQAMTVTANGAIQKDEKQEASVQFDGVEKVLGVDANGKETKVALTADKLTLTSDGNTADVVPKGTVITCSVDADKKQSYEIDGKAADPAVGQALDMVVDLSRGGPTDDEVFGTKDRKKKGDSWDVNGDMAKKQIEVAASGAEFSNITGKSTLDDVTGDTMKISMHIKGDVKPPLPPSIVIDQASVDATFNGTFPTDTSKYQTADAVSISISFSGHTDTPDGKVVVKSTMEQSGTRTITPVK